MNMKRSDLKPTLFLILAIIGVPIMIFSVILEVLAKCIRALSYVIVSDTVRAKREIDDLLYNLID